MFDRNTDYPTAIASYDDDGVEAALEWCEDHMQEGDTLAIWTSLKSNLSNSRRLDDYVRRYRDVEHITGRGGGVPSGPGPVLMAWADMEDVGEIARHANRIRALCVITWSEDRIRPWVSAKQPTILGDGSAWESLTPELDPVVVEALESLTMTINHNNTISAGFEKDQVVSVLLALKQARVPMDADAMEGWAVAHGWSGKNPRRLSQYVRDIQSGKRPQTRNRVPADYIDGLRERVQSRGVED
ncbi:hypothetical protein [uncultured Nocardioides sp.]|uniref:hypothetical protein n=1 Tax=uncultured Nocardioides sp. TaxID=198441 RepID=UPI002609EBB2|nr:hypothetical protein [uncultured Nocardioides sp.]